MAYHIEKTASGADIVLDGMEKGISDNPYDGISDMRNVNIISVPKEASVNFSTQSIAQVPISAVAYTVDTNGLFTYNGTTPIKAGTKIALNTVTGGTVTVSGVTMTGNSSSLTSQFVQVAVGSSRIVAASNNKAGTSASIKIGLSSNPSNNDIILLTLNNTQISIKFVSSIGATAGNVLIGADADTTVSNLRYLLQHPSITSATQVALSAGNQTLVGYFTTDSDIVYDNSASTTGAGALSFSSAATGTLTNGAAVLVINNNGATGRTATWGGVAMTDVSGSSDVNIQTFILAAPPAGVATVAVSGGGATQATAMTFSGVHQTPQFTNQAGANPVAGVGDVTQSITPTNDASVPILIIDALTLYSAGTNITLVNKQATLSVGRATIPLHPSAATNYTMTRDGGGTGTVGRQIGALRSATVGTVTVGLATGTDYWIDTVPSATTFTLTTISPYATGAIGSVPPQVPASGSGTFSTSVNLGLFVQIVPNATNTAYYGIDTNGRVWVYALTNTSTNWIYLGNTATAASTPDFNVGIAVWNGYVMAFYDGTSGYYSYTCPTTATPPVWTAFKQLTNGAYPHRTFTDKNTTLYWCDGNQIGSLIELTTFDPTSAGTYTWSAAALLIQSDDISQCMEQLGTNLIIGGIYNQNYVWDRFSTGYIPLLVPENNTHRLVTVNSTTYMFVGNRGRIYQTNGANVQLYKKIPDHLSGTIEPIFTWGGAMYNKNQLYFSLSAFGSSVTAETGISQYGGIWAIDTTTDALRMVNQLSYGTYGGYCSELCGMIANATSTSGLTVQNFGLVCGWEDSTETASPNYGSDVLPVNSTPAVSNTPYTSYTAYVDFDLIPVGTYLNPATDTNVEFKLTTPLVSGEGVKLAYRQKISDSFTDITNGEFTTVGAYSGVTKVNFQKSQWLQIRCYLKSTATTPSYTRLKEVRLR